ncbi:MULTISPECIES: hypothetical protein [Bacillus cereus group]|uniref:hypothetical protein n=1 Tax=Bacillus cereus group TaxID=86661 RepID=UPI00065F89E2|nr:MULTISPECIES: hypothetical protein [Bacillus cereus group]AWC29117.1 hypothetical protein CG483_012780 [Bacillus cytotoxicus]AWC33107.1 hypothetical protein CG482_012400 [Bacillus cytotoxicus]AWC37134.1 hypothetical protein CG481_012415 [Bacillus cytotoxicus]AWC39497.1 hypothetical protein CG480_002470 [Bacillus cytotoxicus]AWC47428.1 hypothetical protein CG478_002470 [Bacillus cytotoxicus]
MILRKFPVVGRYRNYEIEIEEVTFINTFYQVRIYLPLTRNILGLTFRRRRMLYGVKYAKVERAGEFVEIAKESVNKYESFLDKQIRVETLHETGIDDFKHWDGLVEEATK